MADRTVPTAIVTGGSVGIGFHTARALARRGYTTIIATRNADAGRDAARAINRELESHPPSLLEGGPGSTGQVGKALFMLCDTSSLASVRSFVDAFLGRHGAWLHVLVLNAGTAGMGVPRAERITPEGFERTFATNFLGHYLLATRLLDTLKFTAAAAPSVGGGIAPAVRVVCLGSVTHRLISAAPDWPAVLLGKSALRRSQYALSKFAAVSFAAELQRRLAGSGVAAVAVNPGAVRSTIWRNCSQGNMCWLGPLMRLTFLTPEQGSATSVAAATALEVGGVRLDGAAPVYLSPYAHLPAWLTGAAAAGALAGDLLGPFAGASPQAPTPLSVDARIGLSLWDACEAAVARTQGAL